MRETLSEKKEADPKALTDDQMREVARRIRYAVQANLRCWDNIRALEKVIKHDLDGLPDYVDTLASCTDSVEDFTLQNGMNAAKDLLKLHGFTWEEEGD